jgi:lycopene beta-cyclase
VLPIVLGGDIDAFWRRPDPEVPRSGLRAALFHPTTGYSLPDAVRLADELARLPELRSELLQPLIRERSRSKWRRDGFYRLLNRMLFRAARPEQRYRVLQRFYRLPEPLIQRFYADRLTLFDRARILSGRPPVPLVPALRCLWGGRGEAAAGPSPVSRADP